MLSTLALFIVWDISPEIVIFHFFNIDFPITWYGLFFAFSFVVGQPLISYVFRQENKPASDVDSLTLYVGLATVVGARVGHFIFYEWEILLAYPVKWLVLLITPPFRGLASHGGGIGIFLGLYLYCRKKPDQPFLWVTDRIAIAVSLGGFIRLGNFFNSEIYGKPTTLPWGVVFARETDPDLLPLVPRHPTQLYEAVFCLVLLGLTFYLWKYKRSILPAGAITGIFMILLFIFRFLIEFLKNNQAAFEGNLPINMGQILSGMGIIAGIGILLAAKRNTHFKRTMGISNEDNTCPHY
ncbi:MAG: prolipoprotein diacylglyceryl transferase [Bacteroidota bacterium]